MKRLVAILLALFLVLGVAACSGGDDEEEAVDEEPAEEETVEEEPAEEPEEEEEEEEEETSGGGKIGVSMPTQSLQRWNQDGENMKAQLEAAGYEVDLQFGGDNDIPTQIAQIENMIAGGCEVLVIAAIDGESLTTVLEDAKAAGIPVIAYDRLIMNSDAVEYYATFDNWMVGTLQGQYIVEALDLDNAAEGETFNIEFFTGSPDDNNINFFFGGAMEVLQPYLDSGVLVCPSGQTEMSQVTTMSWSTEESQSRMENLISAEGYGPNGTPLHAVLSSNDSVANGITNALVAAGYTEDNFPVLTGQDCDVTSVKNMIAGTGVIPTYLCDPVFGSAENYQELLIDSGYYTEDELS